MERSYLFYGQKLDPIGVEEFLRHVLQINLRAELDGRRKTPVCVWGTHGIGKTELVQQLAPALGFRLAYVAPAQFEEMGDLLGMPSIGADGKTHFCAPAWVPVEEGPGILLIDDVNRADLRILRGIMQLLQRYELMSWRLPPRWQIVLTANPDGGDYSVTPMDGAMLTRMLHVTMQADVKAWAAWAERSGVDPRGINFVLAYPEMFAGERTTPRSLVQFFELIAPIEDLEEKESLVAALAESCLDRETAASFVGFVRARLGRLLTPAQVIGATDFAHQVKRPIETLVLKKTKRVDVLAVLCTRVVNHLKGSRSPLSSKEMQNLKAFLSLEVLPSDLRLVFARELAGAGASTKKLLADPEIARLVLQGM